MDGYVKNKVTDSSMEEANFPGNILFNKFQKDQKCFYGDNFILGQVIEAANVTTNIETYVCLPNEIRIF